ncbi:MAG: hypothetical protein UU41_C0040G0003 [Candidatus Roizmanbacteria bacterium GW2011_GWA1_41_13]|uniref:Uncharacterized protein n=1 Tax=Candidatus Roizmanbacteria bacterium GW2011_GWA1_41_13 TaxID=1618474 RepID=A0A0G0URF2_9BACT|nr:MAG: hypothetical protein UU41_C0040G0003 [Candidatus Roizmanbacteria bacterium GW2011_GWA1_41_13]
MFVSIITDCCDDNALNRQAVRYMSYLHAPISKIGLTFFSSEGNGELGSIRLMQPKEKRVLLSSILHTVMVKEKNGQTELPLDTSTIKKPW